MRFLFLSAITIVVLLAVTVAVTVGQDDPLAGIIIRNSNEAADTTTGPQGGRTVGRGPFVFETVFDPEGILIFLYDSTDTQFNPENVTGTCLVIRSIDDSKKIDFQAMKDRNVKFARLGSTKTKRGYHLFAPYDFSLIPDGGARARIDLYGLPAPELPEITFAQIFGMSRLRGWSCRGHEDRMFLEYKDSPLCEKRYLDEAPFLFQCPNDENSRDHQSSKCPLCDAKRVPTRQSRQIEFSRPDTQDRKIK